MGATVQFQKKITVTGTTTAGGNYSWAVLMPSAQWVDFGNFLDGIFTVRVHSKSTSGTDQLNIGLATVGEKPEVMNGAAVPDGPAWDIENFFNVSSSKWYKCSSTMSTTSGSGDGKPIDRWVYWFITVTTSDGVTPGSGGAWSVEFEVSATAKRPA